MSSVLMPTLGDVALPRPTRVHHDVLVVLLASVFTGLMAQVVFFLPWSPVPVTGQTFAVLLTGAVLGSRRGFFAQMAYLAQGLVLPVFAAGTGGWLKFVGPTGGYLLAFPLAAALVGALCERGWDRRFVTMAVAMLLGSGLILALGAAMLGRLVPAEQVLAAGVWPFVPGEFAKAALAACAFPAAWRFLDRSSPKDRRRP